MLLKTLIALFWIGQIWTSPYVRGPDSSSLNYNPLFIFTDSILQENTLVGGRFSIYEIVLFLLGSALIFKYGNGGLKGRFAKKFFLISLAAVSISFFNPNNSFEQLKYFITLEPRMLLFYLFLLYAFLSIETNYREAITFAFISSGIIIASLLAVVSLFNFTAGKGIFYISAYTTLPNAEILNVMILLSAVSLAVYLRSRYVLYLIFVLLVHITVLFSDRRTPIVVMLLTDAVIFIYYNKISLITLIKTASITAVCLTLFFIFVPDEKPDFEYYFLRIWTLFSTSYQGEFLNDMGHYEQTARTFETLLNNADRFWGAGMRNSYYFVEGQSSYIHNNFAAVWALYGMHMTLFLFYVLWIYMRNVIKLIGESFKKHYYPVKAGVIIASLFILLGDAFTGEYFCKNFSYVSLFPLSISFLSLSSVDEAGLLLRFKGQRNILPAYRKAEAGLV